MKKKIIGLGLVVVLMLAVSVIAMPKSAPAAEAVFIENGELKRSHIDNSGTEEVIAVGVDRTYTASEDGTQVLYGLTKKIGNIGGDVWVANVSGSKSLVAANVIEARMSAKGGRFVIWKDDNTIAYRIGMSGEWKQIGLHGAAPAISRDGAYILYEKLADSSPDGDPQGLFEFAKGIAVYDISTGEERLLTNTEHGEDFAPLGFSADGKTVYFNSTRASGSGFAEVHNAALWAVAIDGNNIRQLTNKTASLLVPIVDQGALWSDDGLVVISALPGSKRVWKFVLRSDGNVDAEKIADGSEPRWSILNKQIVVRAEENGKTKWKKIDTTQ